MGWCINVNEEIRIERVMLVLRDNILTPFGSVMVFRVI